MARHLGACLPPTRALGPDGAPSGYGARLGAMGAVEILIDFLSFTFRIIITVIDFIFVIIII